MITESSMATPRRSSTRIKVNLNAQIVFYIGQKINRTSAKISDISQWGFSTVAEECILPGTPVSISIMDCNNNTSINITGKITWTKSLDGNKSGLGIKFAEPSTYDQSVQSFINSILKSQQHTVDRRGKENSNSHLLNRRAKDYLEISFQSPLCHFFERLEQVKNQKRIQNIIISKSMSYLQKRVRKIFPNPQIVIADQLDRKLYGETLLIISLDCRHKHEKFNLLDFEEYLIKNGGSSDPLKTLSSVSRSLSANDELTIISFAPISNRKIAEKFLRATKFENIHFENEQYLSARKRILTDYHFNSDKYRIREIETPQEIREIQLFASKVFSNDFNFSDEIDSLFTDHSDFYAVTNSKTKELINFARITWHLPGHALPCMLAHKQGTNLHLQLNNPDEVSYGEIFSPYLNSLGAARTYDELVKTMLSYGDKNWMDVAFTTFNSYEKKGVDFFNRYFGFKDTGFSLQYGTFGGTWKLISVLKNTSKNISLNFLSRPKLHNSITK